MKMCEVFKNNFKELYPVIEKSLKNAAFIAIDSEFSGLVSHSRLKNSLFDSAAERYLKLKLSIEQFTVFQFGLAVFQYDRDNNTYLADVFTFYTFPCAFGPVDNRFLCQASSWEFLRAHNFNFNKVAYDGIPFLNSAQEKLICSELKANTMFSNLERSLSYRDEDLLQAACSKVAQWLPSAESSQTLHLDVKSTDYCLSYFIHKEIRNRFKEVWTFPQPAGVIVRRMSVGERKKAQEEEGDTLDAVLLDNLLGFTKVFRMLVNLKKPIIGHNLLLDLMIIYNQMFEPLPSTYADFKKQLNVLFPSIFDTKYISYQVREILKKQDRWSSNALDQLYLYFSTSRGKTLASFTPNIKIIGDENCKMENIEMHVHEAAWDAFMTGYCFIRMAHYLAIRRLGENALPRALSRVEHVSAVLEYRNRLNVIRGYVSHVNIGGEEPPSNRPRMLYVKRYDRKPIDLDHLTALMASFGNVDVKSFSKASALIAVPNKPSARDIVRAFNKDTNYKVVHYSFIKHNYVINTLLWSGLVLSGSFFVAAVIANLVKK